MATRPKNKVLGGSIIRRRRSDGSWSYTAQVYRRNPETGRAYRGSKGTFKTWDEAERAITLFRLGATDAKATTDKKASTAMLIAPTVADLVDQPLDLYLESWLQKRERNNGLERRSLSELRDQIERYIFRVPLRDIQVGIVPIAHYRLNELTPEIIGEWVRSMETRPTRPLSWKTRHKALYVLHNALGDSKLAINPAKLDRDLVPRKSPKLGDDDDDFERWPTVAEVEEFLVHMEQCDRQWGSRLIGLWKLAAHTGMRREELCGSSWKNLDWEQSTLRIKRSVQIDHGVKFVKGPKSDNGDRLLGLYPSTMKALHLQGEIQAAERQQARQWRVREFDLDIDFMFRDKQGASLNPDGLTQAFIREWEQHARLREGPTLHTLRHTHASALLEAGVPESEVAFRLGDDPAVVRKNYRHVLDKLAHAQRSIAVGQHLYR